MLDAAHIRVAFLNELGKARRDYEQSCLRVAHAEGKLLGLRTAWNNTYPDEPIELYSPPLEKET